MPEENRCSKATAPSEDTATGKAKLQRVMSGRAHRTQARKRRKIRRNVVSRMKRREHFIGSRAILCCSIAASGANRAYASLHESTVLES